MSKYRFWKTSSQLPVACHRHRGISSAWEHDNIASPLHNTVSNFIAIGKYRDSANAGNIARVKHRYDRSAKLQAIYRRHVTQGLVIGMIVDKWGPKFTGVLLEC